MGVITIVFIFFFGPQAGGLQQGGEGWAVQVEGKTIKNEVLESTLQRMRDLGQNFEDEERYAIKRAVGYDYALIEILAKEAEKSGLSISDNELHCYIVNWNTRYRLKGEFICKDFPRTYTAMFPNVDFPFYATREGGFSPDYADNVRYRFQMPVAKYEEAKRKELLALRYLSVLSEAVPVSKEAAEHQWRLENDGVDLELVIFDPTDEDELNISDEDVDAFVQDNSDAIRAYYDDHAEDYAVERTTHLRRVYIRKPDDEDALEDKKKQVDELLEQAKADDVDFEELARQRSEITSEADKGGDMGTRGDGSLASEFRDAIDTIQDGGVALVEQAYAWSIIQVVESTPEGLQPLDEDLQRDIAHTVLVQQRSAQAAVSLKQAAQDFLAKAKENSDESLEKLAGKLLDEAGVYAKTTGILSPAPSAPDLSGIDPSIRPYIQLSTREVGEIPHLGVAPTLAYNVAQLTDKAPVYDEVAEVDGKYAVIRLKESVVAKEVPADQVSSIRTQLQMQRAEETIGFNTARQRLLLHTGEPWPVALQKTLDTSKIAFNEKLFSPRKSEQLDDF